MSNLAFWSMVVALTGYISSFVLSMPAFLIVGVIGNVGQILSFTIFKPKSES